jgi:hypothetical protein
VVDGILEALQRIQVGTKGAVRAISVKRAGPDSWSLWAPGNCTCSAASLVDITTQHCAETIVQLRAKRR